MTTPEWSHFRQLIFMSPCGPSTLEALLDCSEQVFDAVVHNIMLIGNPLSLSVCARVPPVMCWRTVQGIGTFPIFLPMTAGIVSRNPCDPNLCSINKQLTEDG